MNGSELNVELLEGLDSNLHVVEFADKLCKALSEEGIHYRIVVQKLLRVAGKAYVLQLLALVRHQIVDKHIYTNTAGKPARVPRAGQRISRFPVGCC